jgi:hypothetical protein
VLASGFRVRSLSLARRNDRSGASVVCVPVVLHRSPRKNYLSKNS